jgi:chemotaxis response regulator CheB
MGESRRVALLARPGEACERLRAALREAGGDIVLEADPSAIEPQALRAAAVETVLVVLDPAVEDALEKFDDVLSDRAIEVIFDEADLAARREGWDAARWVRHLSAKLHRHDDVLPPGREPEAGVALPGAITEIVASDVVEADVVEEDVVEAELAGMEVQLDSAADMSMVFELPELASVEVESIEATTLDTPSLDTGSLEFESLEVASLDIGSFDLEEIGPVASDTGSAAPAPIEFEGADMSAPSLGGISFTDDINALDFDAGDVAPADVPAPTFGHDVQDFDALMRDLGAGAANDLAGDAVETLEMPPVREFKPAEALPNMAFDIAPIDAPTAKDADLAMPDFGSLSLEAVDDLPAGATATFKSTNAPVAPKFKHDLSELERKISSLSLVGEAEAEPVAAPRAPAESAVAVAVATVAPVVVANDARGAVLILAGIGGPDAVRQILTALPIGFPRAVLISQRLDGGRYDRLVQQMARAASLPVHLAEASTQIAPGHVYIVPPELGVDATDGLRFATGVSLLDALPADDTAVLLLSGADPALVDPALAHASRGALVSGQSPDGCYDAAAPIALTARGGTAGTPTELVQSLLQRWPA